MDATNDGVAPRARTRGRWALVAAPVALALVGLTVAACDAGSRGDASASGGDAAAVASAAPSASEFNAGDSGSSLRVAAPGKTAADAAGHSQVQQRQVISTGKVFLDSRDVDQARAEVDAVLVREGGQVADEDTITNRHGTVTRTMLVLRVPSDRFADAMHRLAGIATLRSSSREAQDVATEVIDLQARIEAQRAGVRRLRVLVSRTGNLRALLAVERALASRQGTLESLQRQRAYLADQTSMATITVQVTRQVVPTPAAEAAGGFVGGLHRGWHGLVRSVTGVLVGIGVALPFAILLLLVGVPAWLVARRTRRAPAPPQEPVES